MTFEQFQNLFDQEKIDSYKSKIIDKSLAKDDILDIENRLKITLPKPKSKIELAEMLIKEGYDSLEKISTLINEDTSTLLSLYFGKVVFNWNDDKPIKDQKRYITQESKTPYRHQVLSALSIYQLINYELKDNIQDDGVDPNDALGLFLEGETYIHPDQVEQSASRAELFLSPGILSCMVRLYWDKKKKKKRHIGGSSSTKLGDLRSFVSPQGFYKRTSSTWFFQGMTGKEVWALLKKDKEYTDLITHLEKTEGAP